MTEPITIVLGEQFGPVSVRIDEHLAKAHAFAQDDYGWLLDRRGGARPQVPTLILGNRLLRVYEEKFERHANRGALHTRQQVWHHRPVFLGDTVTITGRYVEGYERRGRLYLVLESTAADARGERVMTALSTEAMPDTVPVDLVGSAIRPAVEGRTPAREQRVPIDLDDDGPESIRSAPGLPLVVGARLATLHKTVEQDQISVFSGAGQYERNFHTDPEKAREAGFPRPIAQAMQTVCAVGEWLAGLFGAAWTRTGWQDTRFLAPVLAGDELAITGRVASVDPDPADVRVALELWVRNQSGRTTAIGRAGGSVLARDVLG